jgi:hypothetical protein
VLHSQNMGKIRVVCTYCTRQGLLFYML